MSESKRPSNHLILLLLFLIVIGLIIQGIMVSKLYIDTNPESRLLQVSERVETLENKVRDKFNAPQSKEQSQPDIKPEPPAVDEEKSRWRDRLGQRLQDHKDWYPFQEMRELRDRINEMFGHRMEKFREFPGFKDDWLDPRFVPAADFNEKTDHYLVRMDLPGIEKSELKISINNHVLTVSGQRDEVTEMKEGDKVLRTERRHGEFQRSFKIPGGIKMSEIKSTYQDGVLTITIPKGEETEVTGKIAVQ